MVRARMPLTNQGFVRVLDHFPVTTEHEQFTVVVEEFVGSDVLRLDKFLDEVTKKKQALRIDEVATVVRRAVEALKQFHECKAGNVYGLLRPAFVLRPPRSEAAAARGRGLEFPLGDDGLGAPVYLAGRGSEPGIYVAPEVADGQTATAKTDQYMLGQLAFEMLEGRLPFVIRRTSDLQQKAAFWDDPETTASGDWKNAHRAFAKIIFRMLRKDPAQRWDTFDELTKRLFNLEDENRAPQSARSTAWKASG